MCIESVEDIRGVCEARVVERSLYVGLAPERHNLSC